MSTAFTRLSAAMLLAVLSLLAAAGRLQDRGELTRQLSFETEHRGGSPAGWTINPPGSATVDDKVVRGGQWSARIVRTAQSAGVISGLSKTIALDVAGKTILLRAHLRTEDVTGFVALWLRQDGAAANLAFDTTQPRQTKGTNDWHEHTVTVPIRPEGRRLVFGVLLSGTGTAWVDDVELLVDGRPIQDAPRVERPATAIDKDREFDAGSRIDMDTLNAAQIETLTTLGLVWGFLKYHHPAVVSGSRHWDYELFRVVPGLLAASDRGAANATLARWVAGLGPVAACAPCAALSADLHFPPALEWVGDEARLGADLSRQLVTIHTNRPAGGSQFYVSLAPGVGNPVFHNEPDYAALQLPDAGFQLLALYRFWNIIQYWFPYRDVIGEPWEDVLREFIPRVATAKTKQEYERQLIAAIARTHDTHANLWSSLAARPPAGACQLPITVRFIDRDPVVTQAGAGFERGDVLTSIDGVAVSTLVTDWSPYYAASNVPTRLRDIARSMTRGACGEATIGVRRNDLALTLTASRVPPPPAKGGGSTHDLPGETFRPLSSDVAYLKLSTIALADVPGYVEAAAGTKGLIIDIRNYPSAFVVFALGQRFVAAPTPFARFTHGDPSNPGAFRWGPTVSLAPAPPSYAGKVVILVDEVSQSQAEYTAMAFRAAPGARVVGSTTAGADGNVSAIPLPGGLRSMISGIGVFYPDKRPTQRIGIVPDVEVRATIAGVRAGRDEVLEAGIREILGPGVPLTEIQKLIPTAGRRE